MFQANIKRVLVDICLLIAVAFSIYYLSTTHFMFMLSLFHYKMFNIPALAYTLMRFLYILLAIFLLVPKIKIRKIKRLKFCFYSLAILYVLGNTWIIYFLMNNPVSALWDTEVLHTYLQMSALNFDYLVWDSYDLYGILFSTIQAALYFALGYFVDKSRKKTLFFFWLALVSTMLLPTLYVFVISGVGAFSSMWLQKNTILFASGIFMASGLSLAATSHTMWGDVIWG